eukprot:scaffold2446_cov106-Cylindrotheca_fusiformis.AAC.8
MDEFGMNPLHISSLSQTPNLNMFLEVMNAGKRGHMALVGTHLDALRWTIYAIDETLAADWLSRKNEIGRVVRKFEREEILSLLELCLWKVKIDKVTSEQVLLVDRQECRIMSGAAVVIPHVLPFLETI